jgi:hypothetical protein
MIDDIKKIQDSLGSNFKQLNSIMNAHLNQLPQDQQKKIVPIRADISKLVNEMKNGDLEAINKITDKYANIRR